MSLNILVPLDGSAFAEHALTYAAELAAAEDATLHLVMVHSPATPSTVLDGVLVDTTALLPQLRDLDREYLRGLVDDPRVIGHRPVTALLSGPIPLALSVYADSCSIDVIVMSTHGRGGLKRAWLGSVADELVRITKLPVVLLRPRGDAAEWVSPTARFQHVLLPIDASEFSETAIDAALFLGGKPDVRYTLLHVLARPIPVVFADGIPVPLQNSERTEQGEAEIHLNAVATRLRMKGYDVSTALIVHDDVATTIRRYANTNGVDFIAMVTHGRAGWRRLALGSVANDILRHTAVPILILNPRARVVAHEVYDVHQSRVVG